MKENREIIPLRTILQNCLNHIENLESNRSICDNYEKEFQDLKQFSETLKSRKEFACTEGEKEVNRKKNRYKDILPFNVSRVILSKYAGIPGSDYINANYIKGASGSPAYIASQGPLPNTVNDFWRMVVECEVQVIVMACNAEEAGKHKCENYWVEKEGEEKRFGMVEICLVKASTVCPDFLVRTMRLKYTNDKSVTEERTICQFHYSAWPDHGVPPLVRPLLDMVRLVRDTQASETLPVLVHCSAGCGRTGTICAIDFVWGLLRAGKLTEEFSLFNLVKDMRKQRVAMVQTKEQYILVHQAVRELFKEQLRVIESHPYENIDVNGIPLIKDFEEPLYDTIGPCENNCDEKQDENEVEKHEGFKKELVNNTSNRTETAPPLPRKKRPNVPFSKHEKEVENLTEKNRCSNMEKEKEVLDVSPSNSLLSKPRIAKLKALFERSPTNRDRSSSKQRGSQTVSRSHSLGAIRKPLFSEAFDSHVEKNKSSTSVQPIPDGGKLKVPKLSLSSTTVISKPVPLIKRSKSLKTISQPQKLTTLTGKPIPNLDASRDTLSNKPRNLSKTCVKDTVPSAKHETVSKAAFKKSVTSQDLQKVQHPNELYKRRRSLESLIGDGPPVITWPTTVMFPAANVSGSGSIKTQNSKSQLEVIVAPSKNSFKNVQGVAELSAESIKHQLQNLTLEAQKKMNNLVSGVGIRERRNSFRQAISKDDVQTGKQTHAYEYIWIDSKKNKQKLESKTIQVHPYPKNFNEKLTVRNQNGEILHPAPPCDVPDGLCNWKEEKTRNLQQSSNKPETNSQIRSEQIHSSQTKPYVMQRAKTQIIKLNSDANQPRLSQRPHELVRTLSSHAIQDKNSAFTIVKPSDDPRRITESKNLFLHRLNIEIQEGKNLRRPSGKEDNKSEHIPLRRGGPERRGNTETISLTSGTKFGDKGQDFHAQKWKELNVRLNTDQSEPNWNYGRPFTGEKSVKNPAVNVLPNSKFHGVNTFGRSNENQKIAWEPQSTNDIRKPVHRTQNCIPKGMVLHGSVSESSAGRVVEGPAKDAYADLDKKDHRTWISPSQGEDMEMKSSNAQLYPKNFETYSPASSQASTYPKKTVAKSANRNPQIIEIRKKNFFPSSTNSLSSHSSGDMSHSDQHSQKSDSPRILDIHEIEGISKTDIIRIKSSHLINSEKKACMDDGSRHEHGSESSSSSVRELASVLPQKPAEEVYNYGIVASVKFRPSKPSYSRDDFVLGEPVAPPRVKRHASVKIPRHGTSEPSITHLSAWTSTEKKLPDTNNWNDALGIDLDAVAASIQRQKGALKSPMSDMGKVFLYFLWLIPTFPFFTLQCLYNTYEFMRETSSSQKNCILYHVNVVSYKAVRTGESSGFTETPQSNKGYNSSTTSVSTQFPFKKQQHYL